MDWRITLDWGSIAGGFILLGVPAMLYFLWNINYKLKSMCQRFVAIEARVTRLEDHEGRVQIITATK